MIFLRFQFLLLLMGLQVMAAKEGHEDQTPSTLPSKSFKSFSGTMSSNLPVISDLVKKSHIVHPRNGEVLFTSQRWCGDSDVANYYSNRPNEANAVGFNSEKVVLGYWVSDKADGAVPDEKSWFMFGYGDLQIDDGSLTKLKMANTSSSTPIASLVSLEAELILNQLNAAPPTQPGKPHNVYFAAMLCNKLEDSSGASAGAGPFVPRASVIADGLAKYQAAQSENDAGANLQDLAENKKKVNVKFINSNAGAVKISFVGGSASRSHFGSVLEVLHKLAYPSVKAPAVLKMGDYRTAIGTAKSHLDQLVTFCSSEVTKTTPEFWWESIPMHLVCKNVVSSDFSAKIGSFHGGSAKDSDGPVPEAEFTSLKLDLMKSVGRSEILEQAQANIKNQALVQNKARCFPIGGRPYIETIMASLPFEVEPPEKMGASITYTFGGPTSEMTLPEGNYISIADAKYYPNPGAVFMTTANPIKPMSVTTPLPGSRFFKFTRGLFQFHIRDVGCTNGPTYCHRFDPLSNSLNNSLRAN